MPEHELRNISGGHSLVNYTALGAVGTGFAILNIKSIVFSVLIAGSTSAGGFEGCGLVGGTLAGCATGPKGVRVGGKSGQSTLREGAEAATTAELGETLLITQVRALKKLGVDKAGRRAFFRGEVVQFKFSTKGGDVYGFVQYQNKRLVSQLFSINVPENTIGAARGFLRFKNNTVNLARQLGVKNIEFQGGSVLNDEVLEFLIRQGFRTKIVDVPAALGGGKQEVYFLDYMIK